MIIELIHVLTTEGNEIGKKNTSWRTFMVSYRKGVWLLWGRKLKGTFFLKKAKVKFCGNSEFFAYQCLRVYNFENSKKKLSKYRHLSKGPWGSVAFCSGLAAGRLLYSASLGFTLGHTLSDIFSNKPCRLLGWTAIMFLHKPCEALPGHWFPWDSV